MKAANDKMPGTRLTLQKQAVLDALQSGPG